VIRLQRCFGPLAARAAGTYRLVGAYVGRILKGANTGIKKYPCRSVHWFCLAGIVDDGRLTYAIIWAEREGHADASMRPHGA